MSRKTPFKPSAKRPRSFSVRKPRLSSVKDSDGDGVVDSKDCQPFNPKKQGFLHDFNMRRLKKKEEKLEAKREKEQKKLEDLKDELRQRQAVASKKATIKQTQLRQKQAVIDELNREKRKAAEIKEANKKAKAELDKYTFAGKSKTLVRKGFHAAGVGAKAAAKGSVKAVAATEAFLNKRSTKKVLSDLGRALSGTPKRRRKRR